MSRLLIGDNNLVKFWPAVQFSRPVLKDSIMLTATDLDTYDHALSQVEDREVVIISVLTSILMEEVNHLELESSAFNVCEQVVSRLLGMCPSSQGCQFFLAPPERCLLPRWYSTSFSAIYSALVKLDPRFPPNLHLLPVYPTDFTMFEKGFTLFICLCVMYLVSYNA